MKLSPEFEDLIDKKVQQAVDQSVREPWFNIKHIFTGLLIAFLLWVLSLATQSVAAYVCRASDNSYQICKTEG